jgi:hypothetical protein
VGEEAFVPLLRLHPALDLAIPVAGRLWSQAMLQPATWCGIVEFVRALRARRFAVLGGPGAQPTVEEVMAAVGRVRA